MSTRRNLPMLTINKRGGGEDVHSKSQDGVVVQQLSLDVNDLGSNPSYETFRLTLASHYLSDLPTLQDSCEDKRRKSLINMT